MQEVKKFNKMYKKIGIAIFLVLFTLSLTAPVFATSSGTAAVSGVDPMLSAVDITNTIPTSVNTQQIDVNVEYWIVATVTDPNGLAELDNLVYTIWDAVASTKAGADNVADHYTFSYTQSTDTWVEVGPGASNEHLIIGNCVDPASLPGEFKLAFKLDKVAGHADTAVWDIDITVTDDASGTDSDATLSFGVNFYSEITVDDATHGWTGLSPSDTDVLLTSPVDFDIDVTTTQNGPMDIQGSGNGALAKNGDTIPLANVKIHKDTLVSAVSLTTSPTDIGGLTSIPGGTDTASAFQLWITVPAECAPGDYTYTLTVGTEHS